LCPDFSASSGPCCPMNTSSIYETCWPHQAGNRLICSPLGTNPST
jgi:hypothetical protein